MLLKVSGRFFQPGFPCWEAWDGWKSSPSNPDVIFINISTGLARCKFYQPFSCFSWEDFIPFWKWFWAGIRGQMTGGQRPSDSIRGALIAQGRSGQVGSPPQTPKLFRVPLPASAWALQPQKAGFHPLLCPQNRLEHSGSSLLLPGPTDTHIPHSSPSKIYPPGREEKKGWATFSLTDSHSEKNLRKNVDN